MVTIIERSTKMGQKSDSTALCGWTAEKGEGSASCGGGIGRRGIRRNSVILMADLLWNRHGNFGKRAIGDHARCKSLPTGGLFGSACHSFAE